MEQQGALKKDLTADQAYEQSPEYLREILKYVVEIGASLRLQMDADTLLQRIAVTSCKALRFRYAVVYLAEGDDLFRPVATSGLSSYETEYLSERPLPVAAVAQIIDERYRLSDSYFLPADAPIWQDKTFASYFVVVNPSTTLLMPVSDSAFTPAADHEWHVEDLVIVPLRGGDGKLLGFLTPDSPLNGLRPTRETMSLFELFANQAAVVIEGAHLYNELRETVHRVKESERIKNNFLMTASHELRTPLTAVQGYLELLGDYGEALDEESRARFIQNARRGCDELVLLLGNVLDATHLDAEKVILKPGAVFLAQSANLILEILDPIISREQRSVEVHIPTDQYVWADELRLRQILLNVLGNALKYTPTGSPLALKSECVEGTQIQKHFLQGTEGKPPTGSFIVLALRDWGPGIAPAEQEQLFTRFTRLEAARQSNQHGAGLGLYLCRQLITAMGGAIWMESSGIPGEGVTFLVALPVYKA